MKAVIELDVPEWQIGQDVSVYFPDTMVKRGKCELLKEQGTRIEQLNRFVNGFSRDAVLVVRCKDCKHHDDDYPCELHTIDGSAHDDWFCADGERKG